jgi:hypothetical protein
MDRNSAVTELIPTLVILRTAPLTFEITAFRELVRQQCGDEAAASLIFEPDSDGANLNLLWKTGDVLYFTVLGNLRYFESWTQVLHRVAIESLNRQHVATLLQPIQQAWQHHTAYVVVWCLAHTVREDEVALMQHVGRVMALAGTIAAQDAALVWYCGSSAPFVIPSPTVIAAMQAGTWPGVAIPAGIPTRDSSLAEPRDDFIPGTTA